MVKSFVVYGILEDREIGTVLNPDFVRTFEGVNVFIDSSGCPIYGVKCKLDPEKGVAKIVKKKEEDELKRFVALYKDKFWPGSELSPIYNTGVLYEDAIKYGIDDPSFPEFFIYEWDESDDDDDDEVYSYESDSNESEDTPEESDDESDDESDHESDDEDDD